MGRFRDVLGPCSSFALVLHQKLAPPSASQRIPIGSSSASLMSSRHVRASTTWELLMKKWNPLRSEHPRTSLGASSILLKIKTSTNLLPKPQLAPPPADHCSRCCRHPCFRSLTRHSQQAPSSHMFPNYVALDAPFSHMLSAFLRIYWISRHHNPPTAGN